MKKSVAYKKKRVSVRSMNSKELTQVLVETQAKLKTLSLVCPPSPNKRLRRWISNPGVPCSKTLGGSKVDSAFHPSDVDQMSTRNFRELSGKK